MTAAAIAFGTEMHILLLPPSQFGGCYVLTYACLSACVFLSVRSFILCGQGSSLLWTLVLRRYSGPVRLPRERKGIGRCVRCMLATCRVKEGLSRSEQLVGYFYSAPLLDVAYCLA